MTCCLTSLWLPTQLFSSEEKHASQQHRVTVHCAPGPEPFTVFCVTEQTTAKQLLDMVSAVESVEHLQRQKSQESHTLKLYLFSTGRGVSGKPIRILFVWGEGSPVEGAQRGEALPAAPSSSTWGGGGQGGLQLEHWGGICEETVPQNERGGTHVW